ncbi:MAG: type II toxin-antitoxin system PemK/MazF family toxin [Bacteroidales bacterium]|jgi:mRNA interferase MazF|nr:type II toxin-antitoxin system PemK/MazF family toxin [Bacteroidales bacterium]
MEQIENGSIALLKFPFTDGFTYKRRPVVILKTFEDGDMLVCRITSKMYASHYDICIDDWENFGLKLPSVIRVHKMATLETTMIERILGTVSTEIMQKITTLFKEII